MREKKGIIISCVLCVAIMSVVLGIYYCMLEEKKSIHIAENSDQIELFVDFPSETEKINIWQSGEGDYYFFLPAGAADRRITFGNLGESGRISLDGREFDSRDDLRAFLDDSLSTGEASKLVLKTDGGKEQEPIRVNFLRSENIPAMFIDTESGTLDNILAEKGTKEAASLRIWDSGGDNCYNDSIEYIRGRGNSTWLDYEKKPYQIKLNKKESLLDMPAAKRWILLANMLDSTLMKNDIIFRYAEAHTEVPSIEGRFVDFYINGDYVGNYYLCEKIEVDSNRLDITDLEKETEKVNRKNNYEESALYMSEDGCIKATMGLENPADITGGYLLEHISEEKYGRITNAFRTKGGHCYSIDSPSPATVEQAEYICGLLNETEEALGQEDWVNPVTGKHVSEYLNLDSWASKYVMEAVFLDLDTVSGGSMYLYKERDSVDPRIYSGPMWDYDRALGSYGIRAFSLDDPRQEQACGLYADRLASMPEVRELICRKFEEDMIPYIENSARADIYETEQQIEASAEMNLVRWGKLGDYYSDRTDSVEYLSFFLREREDYLRGVWLGETDYCTVTFLGAGGNVYKTYKIKRGESLGNVPVISSQTAVFAGWYVQGENIECIPQIPVLEDVTYESRWIGIDVIMQNGLNMADMDVSQLDPEIFEGAADFIREKQEQDSALQAAP